MTKKLYYENAYCKNFSAVVTDCRERKDGYEIILDRSAFYPEGGGQPGDRGFLTCTDGTEEKRIAVFDTHEKEGMILHYTKEPVTPGITVSGEIDWNYRFDLMQNHSGEHIVSGLIHARFGYHNVGFHMGSDRITIDLDGEITSEEMAEIERQANETVWKNVPAEIRLYDEETVKSVKYRSKKELHGEVRIVTFPGADTCACCGTHVASTGEIGLIRLISLEKFKGGVRIEMLSGQRAYAYVCGICRQNHQISVALSAKPEETADAVLHLKEAAAADRFRLTALENALFEQKAKSLENAGNVLLFEDDLTSEGVRRLAVAVMERCKGRCAVFSGDDRTGYRYAIGEKNGDLRAFIKTLNAALHGRGGGKPFFAQGSAAVTRQEIEAFFRTNV